MAQTIEAAYGRLQKRATPGLQPRIARVRTAA
jgi:hypothetical protein